MTLIVQKFGGSSVANIERIRHVARLIMETRQAVPGQVVQVVVVVSAMLGETDRLVALAHHFADGNDSQNHAREYDVLLSTGECVSAALVSMALNSMGCPARSLTGGEAGILTTADYKKARIIGMDSARLRAELAQGRVPVVTGFQGISPEGEVTTLGRGGSDLTAVAIAAGLGADECQIFTDVDGVYTSDPNIVLHAQRLAHIPFDEMMELASLGAKVLQNRCLEYAAHHQVPLRVLSSIQTAGHGTRIDYQSSQQSEQQSEHHASLPLIRGVAVDRRQSQITLERIPKRPGLLSYILSPLTTAQIEIDMIVHSAPHEDGSVNMSFTLHQDDCSQAHAIVSAILSEWGAGVIRIHRAVAKLSLVGIGLQSHARVVSRMLSALGQEGIDVWLLSTSETKMSAIVLDTYAELGVRVLHEAFALAP